jgi:hypothetical protein
MLKNATSGNSNKFHMQFNVRWAEKPAREHSKSLAGIGEYYISCASITNYNHENRTGKCTYDGVHVFR